MAAAEWYYTSNKLEMGPVSWQELIELAQAGILKRLDKVWTEGMDDWVNAVNQKGLFSDGAEAPIEPAGKKSAYTQTKPPPGRRTSHADDDNDEDEKAAKKAARKRDEERTKMTMGLKMGLTLGCVALLLLLGVGCVGGMIYVAFFSGGGSKDGGDSKGGELRPFTRTNLPQNKFWDERRTFTKGKHITITVTNTLDNPKTNVDLHVYRGTNETPKEQPIAADDRRPNDDINCKVEFTVPDTDTYRVRIINRGPGDAKSCAATFAER